MNQSYPNHKKREMRNIFESFRWLMKDKLISIDDMTRAMQQEMSVMGIPKPLIEEYLPAAFKELVNEITEEQDERYQKEVIPRTKKVNFG